MDIEAVARIVATGVIQDLGEDEARDVVGRIRTRIAGVFGRDARSLSELEEAVEAPSDEGRITRLGVALKWYADRNPEFAADLAVWAADYTPVPRAARHSRAGRDPYVVTARDLTIERNSD